MRSRSSSTRAGLEARERQSDGPEHHPRCAEVGFDGLVDPRVLHLDRHGPVVVGDRPVDLADRRRRSGTVPLGEGDLGRAAQLAPTTPAASSADMGGGSAAGRTGARAWSGSPTSRYDAIWPSFMKAPFMPPSASPPARRCAARRPGRAGLPLGRGEHAARWTAKPAPARRPSGQLNPALTSRWATTASPPGAGSGGVSPLRSTWAQARALAWRATTAAPAAAPATSTFVPLLGTPAPTTRGNGVRRQPGKGAWRALPALVVGVAELP